MFLRGSEKIKEEVKKDKRKHDKYQRKFSLSLPFSLGVNGPLICNLNADVMAVHKQGAAVLIWSQLA